MTASEAYPSGRPVPGEVPHRDDLSRRRHQRNEHTGGSAGARAQSNAGPAPGDRAVTGLVTRARNADRQAWDALVERYAPLIWSICRQHRLGGADADDVGQTVWLHLVEHLGKLRDPAALPGWLVTTTRRECIRVLRAAQGSMAAEYLPDAEILSDQRTGTAEQELLTAERHTALLEALLDLPADCQRLIALLSADPPAPYAEISARLGIPVGSIGPTRRRCLDKIRRHPAIWP